MIRSGLFFVLVIAFATPMANSASESPIKVTVIDLIRHPQKYQHKRVEVIGYLITSCAHCADLYVSYEAEQKEPLSGKWVHIGQFAPNIEIPNARFRRRIRRPYPEYDGYVRVVGRFEFADMSNAGRVVSRSKPDGEGRVIESVYLPQGFGWGGTNSRQVTNVTLLEPLGPELPSKINDYLERLSSGQTGRRAHQ